MKSCFYLKKDFDCSSKCIGNSFEPVLLIYIGYVISIDREEHPLGDFKIIVASTGYFLNSTTRFKESLYKNNQECELEFK